MKKKLQVTEGRYQHEPSRSREECVLKYTSVIPALRRLKPEKHRLEPSLGSTENSKPAQPVNIRSLLRSSSRSHSSRKESCLWLTEGFAPVPQGQDISSVTATGSKQPLSLLAPYRLTARAAWIFWRAFLCLGHTQSSSSLGHPGKGSDTQMRNVLLPKSKEVT